MSCLIIQAQSVQTLNNLAWNVSKDHRWAAVQPQTGNKTIGFTRMPVAATGINFTNSLPEHRYVTNQIYLNGSGVAAGDIDNDGLCDVFLPGLGGGSSLFRNRGNWQFLDVTKSSLPEVADLDATGAAFADVDGDKDLDLILNTVAQGTRIYYNDGQGRFTHALPPGGVLNPRKAGMSIAVADIEGDGDLDFYVANYRTVTIRDEPDIKIQGEYVNGKPMVAKVNGRPVTEPDLQGRLTLEANGRIREHGEPDVLFVNDGKGRFLAEPLNGGRFLESGNQPLASPLFDWGLSVAFRDLNQDGHPDLYVCNDFESEDRIWMNLGDGRFRATTGGLRHTSMFSMGVDFADLNRDGFVDFFVADMMPRSHASRHVLIGDVPPYLSLPGIFEDRPQYSHNSLYINRGTHSDQWRFSEIGFYSGVHATDWSWAPVFLDVDLDGYEDLLVTTGHQLEMMNIDVMEHSEVVKSAKKLSPQELLRLRLLFPKFPLPNVAMRNRGDLTFEDVSLKWGFDDKSVSHGMALADLDNDGDMDLVINNLNEPVGIYRNEATAGRVAVKLRGAEANTGGIGAVVRLLGNTHALAAQEQSIQCGGRYLSSDQMMRSFAAGIGHTNLVLEVTWRSGHITRIENVAAQRIYEIEEPEARPKQLVTAASSTNQTSRTPSPNTTTAWFKEDRDAIQHNHFEEPFDDFQRQPLLPLKLSHLGPGVCWTDWNHDGLDDLLIGTGKGGRIAAFQNAGNRKFVQADAPPFHRISGRDQTSIVGFGSFVFAGLTHYEDGTTNGGHIGIFDLNRKVSGESVLGSGFATGPVSMADIDADGDLDLFIGGRAVAGRYPEAADSLLMRNDGGRFSIHTRWPKLGLVSGASFVDLDADGYDELVLAMDWGPPRVFWNAHGSFEERTKELGLQALTGWWNGVAAADLNNDGKMDLILSNRGLNSRQTAFPQVTRRIRFGDFDSNGVFDVIESYVELGTERELPERTLRSIRTATPSLVESFHTHSSYAQSTVQQIYGEQRLNQNGILEAREFASVILLNHGDRFELRRLPAQAQWSAAFGICTADFDGDGNLDLFLGQNLMVMNAETARLDGGYGLVLVGNGKGDFTAMSPNQSGIEVLGDQRGCAVADYDNDGRPDLVITQNAHAPRLFRNQIAPVGVRVRFAGPPLNPSGVGTTWWVQSGAKRSPSHTIRSSTGYWSQNSAIQVQTIPQNTGTQSVLHYVLPGGKKGEVTVPPNVRFIEVGFDGTLKEVP